MNEEQNRTILQLVLMNETGDSYYRMRWPARDLAFQEPGWRVINLDAQAEERFAWGEAADLLVLYQSNDIDLVPLIERRRRIGKKTLIEYNDNFYDVQAWSPVAEAWRSPLIWQQYELLMRISDGVIVTGEGLRDVLSSHVSQRFFILENHLPKVPETFETLRQKKTPYISIGWGGSLGHIADFLSVLPVLKEVLSIFPEAKLHIMGNESIPSLLDLPTERFFFSPWGTIEQYFRFWEEIHIGIAPLLDTPYNRCRSDIKAVEMSSKGVLPLLSNATPYRHFLQETDLSPFESLRDLKELLVEYIRDTEQHLKLAERCHRYVLEKRVGLKRTERLALYSEMMGSFTSGFKWPCGTGYFEVQGSAHHQALQQSVFQHVNSLYKQGQLEAATKAIETFCMEQPLNADAVLVKLKCLLAARKQEFSQQLQEASFRFSSDLRFIILAIETSEESLLAEKWRAFGKRLESLPRHFHDFFGNEIVSLFLRQIEKYPALIDLSKVLLGLFPDSAQLHYGLAESFRKHGRDKEALTHFAWLCEKKRLHEENKSFLDSSEAKYLEAWRAALEARVQSR